jgi:hypothetical protein
MHPDPIMSIGVLCVLFFIHATDVFKKGSKS